MSSPPDRPGALARPPQPQRRPWRAAWNWGLPLVLASAAWGLNPDAAQHREVLREALAPGHPVGLAFTPQERGDPPVRYTNGFFLSYTRHSHGLATLGAFGQVVAVGRRGAVKPAREASAPPAGQP